MRALVAFATLISAACTAAELPAVVEKPEVVIGESWIYAGYQNEKKFQIKVEIEQLSDREIRTLVTPNGNAAFAKSQAFDRQWNLVEAVDDRNRSVKYSPYLPALDFPLHIGKTWKKNYEWQRTDPRGIEPLPKSGPKTWKDVQDQRTGDNRTWGGSRVEARVLGWEEITVPAGTYTAIKVEVVSPHYAGSETSSIFGRKELAGGVLELYWYVPKIKRYIKYISRLYVNEKLVTSAGLDLVEYNEASSTSPHDNRQGHKIPATIGKMPTEEECIGMIAVLPTFHSKKMNDYYEMNPNASGKELVEKIQSLAGGGDKDAQFTYSMLLLNGYCVPKDVCAARRYLEKSRGGPNNWEQVYPIPPWPKDAESMCN